MKSKTYLGFDFGMKSLGIAVGQNITRTAQPLITISMQKGHPNWGELEEIIHEWSPSGCIIGVALQPDGQDSKTSLKAKAFGQRLTEKFKLPTYYIDERLTSVAAREKLNIKSFPTPKQKIEIDRISAAIILESWLNSVEHQDD